MPLCPLLHQLKAREVQISVLFCCYIQAPNWLADITLHLHFSAMLSNQYTSRLPLLAAFLPINIIRCHDINKLDHAYLLALL